MDEARSVVCFEKENFVGTASDFKQRFVFALLILPKNRKSKILVIYTKFCYNVIF